MSPEEPLGEDAVSIGVGNGASRRSVLKRLAAAGAAVGAAGCFDDEGGDTPTASDTATSSDTAMSTRTPTETAPNPDPAQFFEFDAHPVVRPPGWSSENTRSGSGNTERTAVFVYQNAGNPFFVPMTVGFNDALNNYGWTGQAIAPGTGAAGISNVEVQRTLINNAIDDVLDAGDVLVTTILNPTFLNEALQRAFDNDIVVINAHTSPSPDEWTTEFMRNEAIESGFRYRGRPITIPHVGIRDERAGVAFAAEAYRRLQEMNPDPDGGEYTVLITNGLEINPAVTRRVNASASDRGTAQRYFETRVDPSVALYDNRIVSTSPNHVGARSQIESTIEGDEDDINAVLSADYWGAIAAGNLKEEGVLREDCVIGGFNLDQRMIDNIREGFIDFALGQDPYRQGYQPIPLAWSYLERGMPMRDVEWGVCVYDADNIGFADERRNWSALRGWQEDNYDSSG